MVIIRVRTTAGTWRINDVDLKQKLETFIQRVETEKNISITKVSLKQNMSEVPKAGKSLKKLGLKHGSMIFVELGKGFIIFGNTRREIDENGNVISRDNDKNSFLPGTQALGDISKAWSLTKMVELEKQHTFVLTGDKPELCAKASLDTSACEAFNNYFVRNLQSKQCRCGILYGRYVDSDIELERKARDEQLKARDAKHKQAYGSTKKNVDLKELDKLRKYDIGARRAVVVEAIYEPRQTNSPDNFILLKDNLEPTADIIANSLGLQKVGFIVSRPKKEKFNGSELMAHEVIQAAEISLEANENELTSPFIVVRVAPNEQNQVAFEAFTLTSTCLDMVQKEALKEVKEDPTHCGVDTRFIALVQKKKSAVIDNDFFVKRVPIVNVQSELKETGAAKVPYYNRDLSPAPDQTDIRNYVRNKVGNNVGDSDANLAKLLSNFNVLLYLAHSIPPKAGLEEICDWLRQYVYEGKHTVPFPISHKGQVRQVLGI